MSVSPQVNDLDPGLDPNNDSSKTSDKVTVTQQHQTSKRKLSVSDVRGREEGDEEDDDEEDNVDCCFMACVWTCCFCCDTKVKVINSKDKSKA